MDPTRHHAIHSPTDGHLWLPDLCRAEALLWVSLLAAVLAIILELLVRGANFSITGFGLRALLILWMVLIGCAISCAIRKISRNWPLWLIVLSVLFGIQLASLLGVLGQIRVTGESFVNALVPSQLLSALIGCIALRIFYLQSQESLRAERLKQAEFELLQARIQPHFLFNTLNSILSLISTSPDQAEEAVLNLADLMRSSLNASQKLVSLGEELELCEKYLHIEQLRMGKRLHWDFNVSPEARVFLLPSLSLQPLLENAVLHGVSRLPQGGTIYLEAKLEGNTLCLRVANPIADTGSVVSGNKIALNNVFERLQVNSSQPVILSADRQAGEYIVKIRMVPNE